MVDTIASCYIEEGRRVTGLGPGVCDTKVNGSCAFLWGVIRVAAQVIGIREWGGVDCSYYTKCV